ncbi:MAG: hypothetical protein HY842_13535 [Bacteroidetes bacterium]|nr:hypothetical protein [Bacteroidota bacterium]
MKLEHRKNPLASRHTFLLRLMKYFGASFLLIGLSLLIGTVGYHVSANLGWVDSFFNASMILTGMGPASPMPCDGAKLFSSFYALFSGVAFLSAVSVLMAPVVHRFFHALHVDMED